MAGYAETVTIDTLERYGADLDLAGVSWGPALKRCAVACRASILENFAGAHAPDGTPWAPLRFRRARGGNKPLRDTGVLMASATGRGAATNHIEEISGFELTFGTNDERAAIHQFGGVIRAKRGKYLSLPLTREAVRAGSPRRFAGALYFYAPRGKNGPKFLAENKGKRGKPKLHYLLKESVKIPARPFIGWNDKLLATVDDILGEYVEGQR